MKRKLIYIIILAFFTGFLAESYAQGIAVHAAINREKILIGEPIQLTLEARLPVGTSTPWFALDTIPHFEFIDKGKLDSTEKSEAKSFKQVLSITSFDSGRWVIPAFSLEINGRYYVTDSLAVSVAFSNFDANKDYHDIKDILEIENPEVRYINWALAAITLISLLGVIYFLRKSQLANKKAITAIGATDPYVEAMQSLAQLHAENLPAKGEVKRYYTRLNDVIRKFISRKIALATMEKTNEELLLQIKQSGIAHDDLIKVAQVLRMSDAVKFAKYLPVAEDNEQNFKTTEVTIQLLNNLPASAV